LFACYSAVIAMHPFHAQAFVSQWERNTIVGERLIYAADPPSRIIVGSSIFLTMPQHELGSDTYNLSFAGNGPLTGLAMIERLGLHPREVIIESNTISPANTELMNNFFSEPFFTLRRYLPAFRSEYRPINLMLNWNQFEAVTPPLNAPVIPERVDPYARDQIRSANLKFFASPLSPAAAQKLQADLHRYVDGLVAAGVKVSFLAMPMDEAIANTGIFRSTREAIRESFPEDRYEWVDVSPLGPFETRDGVHLVSHDAIRIARFLRQR
jgi:hypothetical protein